MEAADPAIRTRTTTKSKEGNRFDYKFSFTFRLVLKWKLEDPTNAEGIGKNIGSEGSINLIDPSNPMGLPISPVRLEAGQTKVRTTTTIMKQRNCNE